MYRRFGEVDDAEASPLYQRVAIALSESDEALRGIETAARKRSPSVILAAVHFLALAEAPRAGPRTFR